MCHRYRCRSAFPSVAYRRRRRHRCAHIESDEIRGVAAQNQSLFIVAQKAAVLSDVIDTLTVGAEALDVGHIRAPHELGRPEDVTHAANELLRLRIRIVPDATPRDW